MALSGMHSFDLCPPSPAHVQEIGEQMFKFLSPLMGSSLDGVSMKSSFKKIQAKAKVCTASVLALSPVCPVSPMALRAA